MLSLSTSAYPAVRRQVFTRFYEHLAYESAAGDYVWIHCGGNLKPHWRQIPADGSVIRTRIGALAAEAIIGRAPGDIVELKNGRQVRLGQPTLEEHVLYAERTVTPIYPRDANLIVSRLDLHPEGAARAIGPQAQRLEILEAGTGMGGLTLYLARALWAGNPPACRTVRHAAKEQYSSTLRDSDASALQAYKSGRQAIVHSIDVDKGWALHAARVIASFRDGLYAPTIDQYVSDVSEWIENEFRRRHSNTVTSNPLAPFLHHIILDLPAAHQHLGMAALALRPDGLLVVFVPSVSQIQDAVLHVRATRLALVLDEVIEIGTNMSGGRQWAVELARLRRKAAEAEAETLAESETSLGTEESGAAPEERIVPRTHDDSHVSPTLTPLFTSEPTPEPAPPTDPSPSQLEESAEERFTSAFSAARTAPTEQRSAAFGLVARPRTVNLSGGGFLAFFRKLWPENEPRTRVRRGEWRPEPRDKVFVKRRKRD